MNKDFQNGLIVGLASKGKVVQKSVSIGSNIEVIQPVYINTENIEINNNNIELTASVVIESEE